MTRGRHQYASCAVRREKSTDVCGFFEAQPSTLLPILTLPENIVSDFATHGVPTASGKRKALATATANEVQWAADRARAQVATATGKTDGRSTTAAVPDEPAR